MERLSETEINRLLSGVDYNDDKRALVTALRDAYKEIDYLKSVQGCDIVGEEAERFQEMMDKNTQDYLDREKAKAKDEDTP